MLLLLGTAVIMDQTVRKNRNWRNQNWYFVLTMCYRFFKVPRLLDFDIGILLLQAVLFCSLIARSASYLIQLKVYEHAHRRHLSYFWKLGFRLGQHYDDISGKANKVRLLRQRSLIKDLTESMESVCG